MCFASHDINYVGNLKGQAQRKQNSFMMKFIFLRNILFNNYNFYYHLALYMHMLKCMYVCRHVYILYTGLFYYHLSNYFCLYVCLVDRDEVMGGRTG